MTTERCPIAAWAARTPDAPALRLETDASVSDVSYRELDAMVGEAVERLSGPGEDQVSAGTQVGVLVDDPVEALVKVWALFRIGACACLLNPNQPESALAAAMDMHGFMHGVRHVHGMHGVRHVHGTTVVFTSGSSGTPKGVLHRYEAHVASAEGSAVNLPIGPGDAWALVLPQYHVGGLAISFRSFLAGATIAIPRRRAPLLPSFRRLGVTHASVVDTQLQRMLADPTPVPGLRILVGGSAAPVDHLKAAAERGWTVYATYGLSEMASQVTTTDGRGDPDELRTSGRVLPNRELKVDGEGRILVRGATRFEGYIRKGGFEAPFDEDGWFKTGDLGAFDAEGRLLVLGRADRVFVSGGENISPEAIERVLRTAPGVRRAAVVAAPDPEFGARPVAFVDPPPDEAMIGIIRDTLSRHLPRYSLPVRYLAYPGEAEAAISKVDYTRLAQLAKAAHSGKNQR